MSSPTSHEDPRSPLATAASFSIPRLRTDTWNRLRDVARLLRRVAVQDGSREGPHRAAQALFQLLARIERWRAFPGHLVVEQLCAQFEEQDYEALARNVIRVVRLLNTAGYRRLDLAASRLDHYADLLNVTHLSESVQQGGTSERRRYFEVLIVDELSAEEQLDLRRRLRALRRDEDAFMYELVFASSFEDALAATLINSDIQTAVLRNVFPFSADAPLAAHRSAYTLLRAQRDALAALAPTERTLELGRCVQRLRPVLDLFLVTDAPVEEIAGKPSQVFRRVFYQQEDYQDLHLSILKWVDARYHTPFFEALRSYSLKPTGMFHALPISRGRTIAKSHWIDDMGRFYGMNIFMAETSATTGGLDSLLQPTGSLKRAQELAARAFGSRRTYFVTNGTSTANKIVMQALIRPGDIVLLAHDCHKSHPYATILSGALPVYLDAYPLAEYSMFGGVPLREMKRQLLELRRAGKLDQVRLLLLTHITFDGIAYDPRRVMEELLAIKPDLIFVWDEAWFAYGRFSPTLRQRTAMDATRALTEQLASDAYRREYAQWSAEFERLDLADDATWLDRRLLPDPARARLRVYATQSTHKTLTALRQGSMIHVHDRDFEQRVEEVFQEAYMTHTSTSPNYQILASLDVGRRQVELEGFELVQRSIELAMTLRERVNGDASLTRYFRILEPHELVPERYRPSKLERYARQLDDPALLESAWLQDEFVLDPTRITLHVGNTGLDGDGFKRLLMDRFDIQVNKTSRNTVLLLIHIGTTRGTIAHLLKVLTTIAAELDDQLEHESRGERGLHEARVRSLTAELPPLPHFSRFHTAFLAEPESTTPEGDIRRAFFLAYEDANCSHVSIDGSLKDRVTRGEEFVSASFVTPYPPGFPVLVPGQVVTPEIVGYLLALDVKEIHGLHPLLGLRIFQPQALEARGPADRKRATR